MHTLELVLGLLVAVVALATVAADSGHGRQLVEVERRLRSSVAEQAVPEGMHDCHD
jgi:hypothetical protein